MRRLSILFAALLLATAILPAAGEVRMRLPDAPARFLYDEPGVLSASERGEIEDSLMAMDRRGLQVGVAVFESIHGEAIEDVSLALAEKWQPGSAQEDNGALLVVAIEERKVRVEVGYGLEPLITDAVAGRVIRNDIAPAFREGRYGDGILRAVTSLARVAGGQPLPEQRRDGFPLVPLLFLFLVIFFIVLAIGLGRRSTGSRDGWHMGPFIGGLGSGRRGGGGFGGGSFGGGGGGSFGGGSFGGGGASGSW